MSGHQGLGSAGEVADRAHGPVGSLLLGAVEGVVIVRVLVVLEIDGDRLGVDDVGDVVGDRAA